MDIQATDELTNHIVELLERDTEMDDFIIVPTSCGSIAIVDKSTKEAWEIEIKRQETHYKKVEG